LSPVASDLAYTDLFSTCLISILRLVYIHPLVTSPDFTWNSPLPAIWSCVETNTGIICSCVPTFKGLAQKHFPKVLSSFQDRAKNSDITSSSTHDDVLKTVDSERSNSPFWRVGQKLSVSNFNGVTGKRHMNRRYSSTISEEDEERFVAELSVIPRRCFHPVSTLA